jgi:hypothetical protein
VAKHLRLICWLSLCLLPLMSSFGEPKDEDDSAAILDDQILSKLRTPSIGVKLVPLKQVREEYAKALKADEAAGDEPRKSTTFTLDGLHDSRFIDDKAPEGFEPLHHLVPRLGIPCGGDGLVVSSVMTSGPAAESDIRRQDVIYTINGKKVASVDDFNAALANSLLSDRPLKVGLAYYEPGKGIPEDSARAWKRKTVMVSPVMEAFALLAPLKRTADAVEGNDLYTHRNEFTDDRTMSLSFSRQKNNKPKLLMMGVYYAGESWIFMDELTVRADEKVLKFKLERERVSRRVRKTGGVTEAVYFFSNDAESKNLIDAVLSSKKVLVRMSGSKGLVDHEVKIPERAKMFEVRAVYDKLGGEGDE